MGIRSGISTTGPEIVNATFPEVGIAPFTFTDYVTAMRAKRICINATEPGKFDITGIENKGYNWLVPTVKCDSRRCDFDGQDALPFCEFSILAVSGTDAGGMQRAAAFKEWVLTKYPAITDAEQRMPFKFEFVQLFNSSSAMNDYVKRRSYGTSGNPKISMGVVWEGNDVSKYSYQLRQNSTNYNAPEQEGRPGTQTTPATKTLVDSFAREDDVCAPLDGTATQGPFEFSCTGQYLYNGVLTYQRLVNDFILDASGAAAAGYPVAEAGVQFVPFPTRPYLKDGFFSTIEGMCNTFEMS